MRESLFIYQWTPAMYPGGSLTPINRSRKVQSLSCVTQQSSQSRWGKFVRLRYLGESSSLNIHVWERSTTLPSLRRCKVKVREYTSFLCSTLKLSQEAYRSHDIGLNLGMAQDSCFTKTKPACADMKDALSWIRRDWTTYNGNTNFKCDFKAKEDHRHHFKIFLTL